MLYMNVGCIRENQRSAIALFDRTLLFIYLATVWVYIFESIFYFSLKEVLLHLALITWIISSAELLFQALLPVSGKNAWREERERVSISVTDRTELGFVLARFNKATQTLDRLCHWGRPKQCENYLCSHQEHFRVPRIHVMLDILMNEEVCHIFKAI